MSAVVRPLTADDETIGGKARSLARLRALGLPVPAGFAIATSLSRTLRTTGTPPPAALRTVRDLGALEAARAALEAAPLPADVAHEVEAALAGAAPSEDASVTFAVRSSGSDEDSADGAAPGIYESSLRVPRAEVPAAIVHVLASALSPAAWSYRARGGGPAGELGVLVHVFVGGTAHGAAAVELGTGADSVGAPRIDCQKGVPSPAARAKIEAAVLAAAARFGPSELEWTAHGDEVTFLQLRPFTCKGSRAPGLSTSAPEDSQSSPAAEASAEARAAERDGWTWDAAHNPSPLSPAQAGLVALVDERTDTGLRQRVIDGYLFFKRTREPVPPADDRPQRLFTRLVADVDAELGRLGPAPRLAAALELYVSAYGRLFGEVQAASRAARATFERFVAAHLGPAGEAEPWQRRLLGGVSSAATERAALANAITAAPDPERRQAAADAYVAAFGDESGRWDVAEPTWRDVPETLLFAAAARPSPPAERAVVEAGADAEARARAAADEAQGRLTMSARRSFVEALARAREAAAVAEDDDALFARLQAVVRRALVALGRRLVAEGRLVDAADVFFLPLAVASALDAAPAAPGGPPDLDALADRARRAWSAAAAVPPWPHAPPAGSPLIRGTSGAAGRAIGRVVHHPHAAPLGPGQVRVAATLLPSELPLLHPAAILVETGTFLDHVAAQCRERGIPAVVGAAGARAALREGTLVVVDGDRGHVIALDE